MKPKDVVAACGRKDIHTVRFAFKRLLAAGAVRSEGRTFSTRWMLANQKPARTAKEGP